MVDSTQSPHHSLPMLLNSRVPLVAVYVLCLPQVGVRLVPVLEEILQVAADAVQVVVLLARGAGARPGVHSAPRYQRGCQL